MLWPESQERQTESRSWRESPHPQRAVAVDGRLDARRRHRDMSMFSPTSGMWLWDTVPRFRERVLERVAAGVAVRICLGDPKSDAVRIRGEEEGSGDGMESRCKIAIGYARAGLGADASVVRISGATLYSSIFRFDDELLVNTHFWGNAATDSPLLHLRCGDDRGIAANALRSFDRVWDQARPLAG